MKKHDFKADYSLTVGKADIYRFTLAIQNTKLGEINLNSKHTIGQQHSDTFSILPLNWVLKVQTEFVFTHKLNKWY